MIGSPFEGDRILFELIIRARASNWASSERGTCTAIWSPSKSALNAAQTNGCNWIALPSIKMGSKAWIPRRCSVGARLSITGCSRMTYSSASQTSGSSRSTINFAALMVGACSFSINCWKINGLNNSKAIRLGKPHWCRRKVGPTTITERPE